ncbi:hypothetical protein I6N90_24500 [Paenibacillus sp. GSMTC-2017]|uniref:hypothetical protein n=1 Tax=Paenibacillus sp. GSMTC-2017 TaxID=2794350 RepID=UPI0018D9E833|nr:hypothetical protein [Paenibacillus sp. GSMTC-2017]MBH5320950.1 hypothetical protein [Paenibacillus sp. GSMTC-2017]
MKSKLRFLSIFIVVLAFSFQSVHAQNIVDSLFTKQYIYDEANKLKMIKFRQYGQDLMKNYEYDSNGNLLKSTADWYKDTFEEGKFESTRYTPGYQNYFGKMTNDSKKVINGKYSALGESVNEWDWWEYLYSDSKKIKFEPNTTYQIKFKYKINGISDRGGFFYFFARAPGGDFGKDRGFIKWTGQVGEVGNKTVTFTTGAADDYYLVWGINHGGSISIDDVHIKKEVESFESGEYKSVPFTPGYPANAGGITNDASKVVNGKFSTLGESSSDRDWVEILHTDLNKLRFEPNTTYQVNFNYKVNRLSDRDGFFFFVARAPGGDYSKDRGNQSWTGKVGEVGSKTFTFTTGSAVDYYLIWGLHYGGSLSIDDIQIKKVEESFESGDYLVTHFNRGSPVNAGKITKDPSKVISGKYSILGETASSMEWFEYLHTDRSRLQLEANTKYQVKFKYKINQISDRNGFFYFIARTLDGEFTVNDRGGTPWSGPVGEAGEKTIVFTTGASPNYYLLWGMHRGGSISIDDVNIQKVS